MDVEIDSKLFVTCRLCLEDLGSGYQIVPTIQSQIKYCYDIDVYPFDGLPQLICKKCKMTLNEFCLTKETNIIKQNELKAKMAHRPKENIESQPDLVSSSQQNDETCQIMSKKNKKNIVSSEKVENSVSNINVQTELTLSRHEKTQKSTNMVLQKNLEKLFVCRFCNRKCISRDEISTHLKSHDKIVLKYASIWKKSCVVSLNKIDDTTQNSKVVIFDNSNILENFNNSYYFVKYEPKYQTDKKIDSSSDDDGKIITSKRKRKRILSTSSTDTVVIDNDEEPRGSISNSEDENNKNKTHEADVVINIDDSSEDENDTDFKIKQNFDHKKDLKRVTVDTENALQEIVKTCQTKYDRKCHLGEDDKSNNNKLQSKLKKIVLNIGRKAINKAGFNCKGLLTYLEYRDLEIVWIPKIDESEKKFILIMAKEKDKKEKSTFHKLSQILNKDDIIEPDKFSDWEGENTKNLDESEQAVLNLLQNSDMNSNKLLNASPVLNPKKLPKKNNEVKINEHKLEVSKTSKFASSSTICGDILTEEVSEVDLHMPIITSTTSLAPPLDCETNNSQVDTTNENAVNTNYLDESTNAVKTVPRIKVKPVSELMSQRVLNDLNQQSNQIWSRHAQQATNMLSTISNIVPTMPSLVYSTVQNAVSTPANTGYNNNFESTAISSLSNVSPRDFDAPVTEDSTKSSNKETVILDTVELPNTLTNSPYIYFKQLLYIHNIILVGQSQLSTNFVSLIKFRLRFNQETKNRPIELCLSLLSEKNVFCLCVNDNNNVTIDWTNLSASWQWEILKIFMGNVVPKILQNAQKLGPMVYENANKVLCLLKSIKFRKA